ncbi:hypothetical protein METBIDRAFT_214767 [Metschnikowia bicuspidata var. bicuspidata NRRL YB-4993]|uniref:MICOS complex subunit MIC12 n=1 Tax=Metschnikowia bicuspidata var. bicuspidata NRRL YB-4993 TaxID=869754 RepID=A0A1A0H6F1_9ASCO|nr:hypothetical protein METBIDRAFT_214767 [Metschnikowia bicuspidata var. bicuspidata NRRL YB-4993]OBA19482.1 hypothetical protein METBIDRAFT_214767 [Metschnikowia bicuspidata var. bicuspidata NRRL YB-4993]
MGNRINGFLGGVALTGFITMSTSAAIKRSEAINSAQIRHCDEFINNRILTDTHFRENAAPINKRVFLTHRPSMWETCKDIWNEEIIKMVNNVYSINWHKLGLEADKRIGKMADKVLHGSVEK